MHKVIMMVIRRKIINKACLFWQLTANAFNYITASISYNMRKSVSEEIHEQRMTIGTFQLGKYETCFMFT